MGATLLAPCVAALLAAGCGGGGHQARPAQPASAGPRWFAPDSIWNKPLRRNAPLDPRSRGMVRQLLGQVRRYPLYIATTHSSLPIYTVRARQPRVKVQLDTRNAPLLARALSAVPLPANARPAVGPDRVLAVWQPATDTLWEFWHMTRRADGFHAEWGGKMVDVSKSPGYYRRLVDRSGRVVQQPFWGGPAAKFPVVAGVMTIRELEAGRINHALSFALHETRKNVFSLPAQATDGSFAGSRYIPIGAHFRLDPRLNLARLHLPRLTLMMARAAQRYGIILENSSSGLDFRAQDPTPTARNPYVGSDGRPGGSGDLFQDWPQALLERFPWSHLQLLRMKLRSLPH